MGEVNHLSVTAIGLNIKTQRKKLGYSQEVLGTIAGVCPKYISEIECGKKNPTIYVILKLSSALGVTPETLLQ